MPAWPLSIWLALGAVAGLIVRRCVGGVPPFGIVGDAILGTAGGVLGGYGLALLGIGGGTVGGLFVTGIAALLGAVMLGALSTASR
jgi:uncharacterized membrane protein YeaQ/YmgE (transglycosylase-associated protein family)